MNNEENNFEEFLRSKLENHTVEVSDSVWAGIEKKQKKREVLLWFKHYLNVFIALDIVFLLGAAAFIVLNSNEVQSQNNLSQTAQENASESVIEKFNDKDTESQQNINVVASIKPSKIVEAATKKENVISDGATTKVEDTKQITLNMNISSQKVNKINSTGTIQQAYPIHKEEINKSLNQHIYSWASLKIQDLQIISSYKNVSGEINQQIENPVFLPASISIAKSKKVMKAEQKAIAKEQKKLAKQVAEKNEIEKKNELENKNAIEKKNEIEKAEQENIETIASNSEALTNTNAEAPLSFDTVYGKKKFKGYIAIDALISPDIAWRSLKSSNEVAQNYISKRDSAENIRLSYSATMRVNLFINRNIFIHSGISFSQRREKFNIEHKWQTHEDYIDSTKFVTFIDPFEGAIIYKTYDTLDYVRTHKETISHNVVMSFVDIPAMLGYKWLGKRSGFALQGGVICNLLFKQKGIVADYNYTANDVNTGNQNPFNSSAGLSLAGAISSNFKLNDKLDLLIEPHTRYILKPVTNIDYLVQQKLFTYGLNIGVRLKL